jgi:CHAT domain
VFASAPGGEASGGFELPFSELELENFVLRLSSSQRGRRRMESSQMHEAKHFGSQLFDAVFQQRVRDLYHVALSEADHEGRGLRITLYLTDVPELMHIPWEYLYDDPSFLAISAWTPVVRYLDLPRPRRPLEVEAPLRVLGMVSSPNDAATLDVEAEKQKLEGALSKLTDAGAIELQWLEDASLRSLLRALRAETFHIFHYIGHGIYDAQAEDGVLLLEDEGGRGRPVSGSELGTILHDCTSLRLAVLNACEGARTARDDPFAGVAASLVQREIPAVIAMQFEITDEAAVVFAEGFYEAMAAGFPVDAALAEARKAIFADHNDTEWGTPVLFMRVSDGRIFDMTAPPPPLPAPRLEVALSVDREECAAGETVNWCVSARNEGRSPLSDVTVLDGEGHTVGGPFELPGNAEHTVGWSSRLETDVDQTVTVGGRSAKGDLVSAQATARVAVRPPPPPVRSAPPVGEPVQQAPPTPPAPPRPRPARVGHVLPPEPRTEHLPPARPGSQDPTVESDLALTPPPPPRGRRSLTLVGDLVAAAAALLLMVSLTMEWEKASGTSGWDSNDRAALMAVLAAAVVLLAAVHVVAGQRPWTRLLPMSIAAAGLVTEDRLVLRSFGSANGRVLAVVAAAGIVLGGCIALAAQARGDPLDQPVSGGELFAAVGAVAVLVSPWLSWAPGEGSGWDHLAITDNVLATLAGTVLLIVLARAMLPPLGARPAVGVVLLLLGAIVAEIVIQLRNLGLQGPGGRGWDAPGRFVAAGGAFLIVLGALAAISSALRTRRAEPRY